MSIAIVADQALVSLEPLVDRPVELGDRGLVSAHLGRSGRDDVLELGDAVVARRRVDLAEVLHRRDSVLGDVGRAVC